MEEKITPMTEIMYSNDDWLNDIVNFRFKVKQLIKSSKTIQEAHESIKSYLLNNLHIPNPNFHIINHNDKLIIKPLNLLTLLGISNVPYSILQKKFAYSFNNRKEFLKHIDAEYGYYISNFNNKLKSQIKINQLTVVQTLDINWIPLANILKPFNQKPFFVEITYNYF